MDRENKLHEYESEDDEECAIADIEEGPLPEFYNRLIQEDHDPQRERSIVKVYPHITRLNSDAYTPRFVSIGPYHHGKEHLKAMEARKRNSVICFMKRTRCKPKNCFDRLRKVMPQLMACYEHLDEEWRNDDKFLELMVVDGCFLLECFHSVTRRDPVNDILRSTKKSIIRRDMLLIENQLPIQVLRILLDACDEVELVGYDLNQLICRFFRRYPISGEYPKLGDSCLQALDVFRENVIGQIPTRRWTGFFPGPKFPPATVLSMTGVKFEESETDYLMDIKFEGRILRLPCIVVNEDTETLFLNLMALEKLQLERSEVSSYFAFMGLLIRSAEDVNLLRSHDIILSQSEQRDDDIAKLFRELARNPVNEPDDSLFEVRFALSRWSDSYIRKCNERLSGWGSNFIQTYCKNPWTAIGLVAGTILLIASVTQTVYAVLQFYQNDHSLPYSSNSSHHI